MKRIVTLLNQKNHYLEKFYSWNETHLKNFVLGNFDQIEPFYENRERMLEMIRYIDGQIEQIRLKTDHLIGANEELIARQVRDSLKTKDIYVARILEQDLQVLSSIESAKSEIIKELRDLQKGKRIVSSYKAPSFKKSLDEEA